MINYRETSREAWWLLDSETLDGQIMRALNAAGHDGLTCEQIEERIMRVHQSASGNLRHLCERDLVVPSGRFGRTRRHRRATIWIASHFLDWFIPSSVGGSS